MFVNLVISLAICARVDTYLCVCVLQAYGECEVSAYVDSQVKLQSYSCALREGRSMESFRLTWDLFLIHLIPQMHIFEVSAMESVYSLFCRHFAALIL